MKEGCFLVKMSLLSDWWCSPADMTEEACLDAVMDGGHGPTKDRDLVRQRLYGGFACERPGRRHFLHDCGAYTYTNPEMNGPLTEAERRETWAKLIEANGEPGIGPFSAAGPRDAIQAAREAGR